MPPLQFQIGFSEATKRPHRKVLTISHTGRCELFLPSNRTVGGNPILETASIGFFAMNIPRDQARDWYGSVAAVADEEVPPDDAPPPPGAEALGVFLIEDGVRRERYFDAYVSPKRMQAVGRRYRALEAELLKHPESCVTVALECAAEKWRRAEPLGLVMRFTNATTEAVLVPNPLLETPTAQGRMALMGVRSDINPKDLQPHHHPCLVLDALRVMEVTPKAASLQPIWRIAPGEEIKLDLEVVLDWPPGPYALTLLVETVSTAPAEVRVVAGRIYAAAGTLEIEGQAKFGDQGEGVEYTPPKF